MANYRLKDLRGDNRRTFLRAMGAAAAGFGMQRSGLLNFLLDEGGTALADSGSCASTNRSVHIVSGGGNYCLWQLVWPLPAVATANNATFAYHAPGEGFLHQGDKPFYYGPESPFADFVGKTPTRPMTAFLAGTPVVHERSPERPIMIDGDVASGTGLFAAIAAIQRTTVALLPVIGVQPASLGNAVGAPAIARVPAADDMVGLFNSAASKAILLASEDKALYETYYKAFVGLRRASGTPTWSHELLTTKKAANVIGLNLAAQLQPSPADLTFYGVDQLLATTQYIGGAEGRARLLNMAKALITTKKAMERGLTNSVIIGIPPETGAANGFTDPHGAFDDMVALRNTVKFMGMFLDRFYTDLATAPDPACSAKNLDKTVILTVHGDHPHTPLNRSAWPDSTPGNSNWVYCMGNGYLATGWQGEGKTDNTATGIDPTSGAAITYDSVKASNSACGAIAYAVAKGDMARVKEFYKGKDVTALVKPPPP